VRACQYHEVRKLSTRVGDALLLLWIVTTLTFVLLHLAPGDPATLLVSPTAPPEEIARLRAALGLGEPLPVQYARWIGNVLRGDLGASIAHAQPVATIIAAALPVSLALGGLSLALSYVLGIALGALQARHAGRTTDTVLSAISTTAYAAPSFWLALALVALATSGASAVGAPPWLRLPAFGMRDPAALATGIDAIRDLVRHAILPVLVLAIPGAAAVARYARQAIIDAQRAPHVSAAAARGLTPATIAWRHVFRNALPPLIVLFGLMLPGVVAGSVFVEQIFAWPGLGRTMISAIASRDYPVVLGLTIVYAATVITANMLAELAVLRIDPRRRA
jgi:peptide/nickel transport system permease protein